MSEVVVYFDGVCGLCNHTVDLLLRLDRRGRLRFAPLQGETARRELGPEAGIDPQSFVVTHGGQRFERSAAVLETLRQLGGGYKLLLGLSVLPARWRDRMYNAVAARRYRWFGKRDTCRIPTAAERERFLP
jgi:predicted DCC family thiol-disulfide oxidoreductase YuxK